MRVIKIDPSHSIRVVLCVICMSGVNALKNNRKYIQTYIHNTSKVKLQMKIKNETKKKKKMKKNICTNRTCFFVLFFDKILADIIYIHRNAVHQNTNSIKSTYH